MLQILSDVVGFKEKLAEPCFHVISSGFMSIVDIYVHTCSIIFCGIEKKMEIISIFQV